MMKKILLSFAFILGALSFTNAQFIRYQTNTGWNLGLNVGGTYLDKNRSELNRYYGGAAGLTFGKEYLREDAPLALGWRFRYLRGTAYGYDGVADTSHLRANDLLNGNSFGATNYLSTGNAFVNNYRTDLHEYSLEGVVTFNKLRQKSGVILGVFGGVGLVDYRVMSDVLDADGNQYQFTEGQTFNNYSDISNVLDGKYDAYAHANRNGTQKKFMPSLGVELGYQISPSFSIGLTHKWTWALNNGLDGVDYSTFRQAEKGNDIYHYSGLRLRWYFNKADANVDFVDTKPDPTPSNISGKRPPIVNFTNPYYSNHTTNQNTFNIEADVFNVSGAQQITFKQNGAINHNFTYNVSTNKFESFVYLQPGQNVFEIIATNTAGRDQETRVIINNQQTNVLPPPVVTITNPSACPFVSQVPAYNVQAQVLNVSSSSGVKFLVNGVSKTFSFNPSNSTFTASITLTPGNNNIQITGTNTVGSDTKSCVIVYDQPEQPQSQPPVVDIFNPSYSPYTVQTNSVSIDASVLYVSSKNQINVKVNGVNLNNFTYNNASNLVSFNTGLNPGSNYIQVTASNQDGTASDQVVVVYEQPQTFQPPIVTFTDPSVNPYTLYVNTYNVKAQVLHVAGKSNIQLKINGINTSNFTYSTSSKVMSVYANLIQGANTFEVTATNNDGSDYESTTIVYSPLVVGNPPVVDINNPSNSPYNTTYGSQFISASILNVNSAGGINVKINGQTTNNFSFNPNTSALTMNANLVLGSNTIQITGTNNYGSDSDQTIIIYEQVAQPTPPTVNITAPAATPHNQNTNSVNVTAVTTHINSISQVDIKLNGNSYSNFTLSGNGTIQLPNASLIVGSNIFEITVTNPDGSASDQTIVIYEPISEPCNEPVITINSPQSGTTISGGSQSINLTAGIQYATQGQIMVKLNGVSKPFSLSGTQLSANLNLQVGANTIEVLAISDCGTNHQTLIVTYEEVQAPCNKPVISFIQPQTPNLSFEAGPFAIEASITNVNNASQISFKVNGQGITNFSYDPATHALNASIPVIAGQNTIQISANNECGTSTSLTYIKGTVCEEPLINVTNNIASPTTNSQTTINATINHVNNTNGIVVKVNGNNSSFNFNNGILSISVPLVIGNNTIEINATNSCGAVSKVVTIEREDCNEPVIQLVKPNSNPFTTTDNAINVTAYVQNVSSQAGITVLLNGAAKTFQFGSGNGKIIFVNQLNPGQNTVEIIATNNCGTDKVNILVNYEEEQPIPAPPVVNITTPGNAPYTLNSPSFVVKGTASNIASASQMNVTLNGVTYNNFTFDPNSTMFTIPVTVAANSTSAIVVSATNNDGTDSDNTSLVYTITNNEVGGKPGANPCDDPLNHPSAIFTNPSSSPFSVSNANLTFVVATNNVSSNSNINVKLNGQNVNFNFASNQISIPATLIIGTNNMEVTVSNDCGSETVSAQVTLIDPNGGSNSGGDPTQEGTAFDTTNINDPDPVNCNLPVITYLSPASSPFNTASAGLLITANVQNLNNGSIDVTMNKQIISNYTLSANGDVVINATFTQANNTISINATNDCGSVNYDVIINSTAFGGSGNGGGIGNGGGNGNGNNGHGNNEDGVDSSNPGQGGGGPNGTNDPSGTNDDEGANGNQDSSNGNSGNTGGGNGNNNGNGNNGNGAAGMTTQGGMNGTSGQGLSNADKSKRDQHLQNAEKFFNAGNYKSAKAEYDAALKVDPNHADAKTKSKNMESLIQAEEIKRMEEDKQKADEARRKQEEAARKAEEEKNRQEAAARTAAEEKRRQEEAARKAEEEKNKQEAAARAAAEEKRRQEEAARKAEEEKNRQEAAAKAAAEEKRRQEEAARKAEEEKNRQEAAARAAAEEKRRQEEAARKAEEEKNRQEAAAKAAAEEKRRQEEAARKAAEEKRRQEAAARAAAEEKRRQEEAARKAAEERKRQEAAKRAAEEKRKKEEAAKKAAEEKRKAEEEAKKKAEEEKRTTGGRG